MAAQAANIQAPCPPNDPLHLGDCARLHHSMGAVLRTRPPVSRSARRPAMRRGVAARHERRPVLLAGQFGRLLCCADAVDHTVLCADLDKSVEALDSGRFEGCANGSNAAEVEDQSGEDADCGGDFVCLVVDAAVLHFCED